MAKMLGVGVATVNRDLDDVPDGTQSADESTEKHEVEPDDVPDGTPAWFQDDVDPAKRDVVQADSFDFRHKRFPTVGILFIPAPWPMRGKDSPSRPRRGSIGVLATDGGNSGR